MSFPLHRFRFTQRKVHDKIFDLMAHGDYDNFRTKMRETLEDKKPSKG